MTLAHWQRNFTDTAGNIQAGISVTIRNESTGALAAIFTDSAGGTAKSNPFTTDSVGYGDFYAADGRYRVQATGIDWRNEELVTFENLAVAVTDAEQARDAAQSSSSLAADRADYLSLTGTGASGAVETYGAGLVFTQYNQILRDSGGEFWRITGSTTLPYTTTGAGMPEGGAFVAVGDAVLRNELSSSTVGQGSDLVAHTGTTGTVTETLDQHTADIDNRTIYVDSVDALRDYPKANLPDQSLFQAVRGGKYRYRQTEDDFDLLSPVSGTKFTEKLLKSATTTGLYVRENVANQATVGVLFSNGTNTLPMCVEYNFLTDSNGYIRLYGAVSGYQNSNSALEFMAWEPELEGTFIQQPATSQAYTATVGDKFRATVTGPSLAFQSFCDSRGGLWRIWADGTAYDISTYSAVSETKIQTITDNLSPECPYDVIGEFLGDDPANAPSSGAGTARGWINYRAQNSLTAAPKRALTPSLAFGKRPLNLSEVTRDIISYRSINEFAFKVSNPLVAGDSWVPAHSNEPMLTALEQTILINGRPVADINDIGDTRLIKSFVIEQTFIFRQENDTLDLGRCTTRHSIDESGALSFSYKVTALEDFTCPIWYTAQFGVSYNAHNRLVLNNGREIDIAALPIPADADYDDEDVTSAAFMGQFAATGTYHAAAIDVDLRATKMMDWSPNQTDSPMYLTKRSDDVTKIYWRGSAAALVKQGETFAFDITWAAVAGINSPNVLSGEISKGLI